MTEIILRNQIEIMRAIILLLVGGVGPSISVDINRLSVRVEETLAALAAWADPTQK